MNTIAHYETQDAGQQIFHGVPYEQVMELEAQMRDEIEKAKARALHWQIEFDKLKAEKHSDTMRLVHLGRADGNLALCEWEPGDSQAPGRWATGVDFPVTKLREMIDRDMQRTEDMDSDARQARAEDWE